MSPPSAPRSAESDAAAQTELQALIGRIALGDRAAFERLYTLVRARLFGVVLRIHSDRAQAEEILQDVFVKIWRGARTYDMNRSNPMGWLVSVARYRAIDSLRERASEPATTSLHSRSAEGEDLDLLEALPSQEAGPAEVHEQRQDRAQLLRCMGELSSEQRQCLSLAYVQGYSHAEVASHLSFPLGSVKSWVRRGLLALQHCMGAALGRSPNA
jgi:RNA polymerase sigma factor (sigma-70 family)